MTGPRRQCSADVASRHQRVAVDVSLDEIGRHGHATTDVDRQKLRPTYMYRHAAVTEICANPSSNV